MGLLPTGAGLENLLSVGSLSMGSKLEITLSMALIPYLWDPSWKPCFLWDCYLWDRAWKQHFKWDHV